MPLTPPAPSPGDQITPDARPRPLTPLPRSTQTKLRSTLLISTLPHLLSELLHNSLDAGAGKIEIWIDPSKEGMSLRVEDDGHGMDLAGLKGIGQRWRSSKGGDWAGGVGYGFRGEALASIAALGLLEIITRPTGSVETYAKVIRTSKVLFEGASTRSLGRERGTTVLVRDLYLDIPIRQAALAATASTAVAACRKVLETLALVRHDVKWALWEETAVGSSLAGPKKIFSLHGAKNSVEVFRSLYGVAGVESVQSIRVTSGKRRIDGFIGLKGSITKSHQHLYVNGYPLDRCELQSVIMKRFAQSKFSVMTDDGTAEFTPSRSNRRSPRRLERYPIYVLNIQIPSAELDASYTPGKTVMGYKEEEGVKAFVLAVVEEFLRRHEFISTSVNGRRGEDTLATPDVRLDPARICASTAPMLKPRSAILSKSTNRPSAHKAELAVPHQHDSGSTAVCKPPDIRSGTPASVLRDPRSYAACQTPKRPYSTPTLKDMLPPTTPLRMPQSALDCDVGSYRPPSCPVNAKPTGPVSSPATNRMLPPITPLHRPMSALSGSRTARLGFAQSVRSGSGVSEKRKAGRAFTVDDSGRKRYKWIDEILADVDSGVLPFTPKAASLHCDSCTDKGDPPTIHPNAGFAYTLTSLEPYRPTSEITFSGSSLCSSRILGQIDAKFICAIIPSNSPTSDPTIVMIDQHAADERVSVEAILQDLCEGFMADSIPITELAEPLPAIILSRQEVTLLVQPGINDIFMRWGVELDLNLAYENIRAGGSEYVQIPVRAVPTSLKSRLARKEASEMTRLVKLYLADLETEIGQVRALMSQTDEGQTGDWGQVLRWMPKEMLELANSKACRNAIMFGDRLTLDQCERLVHQLGKTRFPFMCAHGRPSMVPLTTIAGMADNGKRIIDWRAWQGTMR